ncbi:hypothetical protein [Burkholderia vietnamiensis]|jgi:hypothetical protein|uniref:hypothetical protein n=1 Tax=Burkholderia vietnamiensis TaxID=60552 RepID=UPI003BF8B6A4
MILTRIGIIRAPPHVVLMQDHGNRVDQQPDETADERAVQTDELKVTTDVQLEFLHDLVILPVFHLARDEATDPWAQVVRYRSGNRRRVSMQDASAMVALIAAAATRQCV